MKKLFFILLSLFPVLAIAAPEPQDKYLARHCSITPEVKPIDNYPGHDAIVPSNKLVLPAGKAVYPDGQLVFLSGRLFDENCVPISDAVIDIWQANPQGRYVFSTLEDRLSPYPDFTGTGRAVTDNLGRYNFVTLFPGAYDKSAPHIHFHIVHKSFPPLDTEMFFADDKHNPGDEKLRRLTTAEQTLVTAKVHQRDPNNEKAGINAQWDITLTGVNPFRRY